MAAESHSSGYVRPQGWKISDRPAETCGSTVSGEAPVVEFIWEIGGGKEPSSIFVLFRRLYGLIECTGSLRVCWWQQ